MSVLSSEGGAKEGTEFLKGKPKRCSDFLYWTKMPVLSWLFFFELDRSLKDNFVTVNDSA